jgi:hypothetical protein
VKLFRAGRGFVPRNLPECHTTVVVELYRVCNPDWGIKEEVPLLLS